MHNKLKLQIPFGILQIILLAFIHFVQSFPNPEVPKGQKISNSTNEIHIVNRCSFPVWPAIKSDYGSEILENGGFQLVPFSSKELTVSEHWSGQIWGRTECILSNDGCTFLCSTGDCGSGCCGNSTGKAPLSIVQLSFGVAYENSEELLDRYSVNMAQGHNLLLQIRPVEGKFIKNTNKRFDCNLLGCFKELNSICPEKFSLRDKRSGKIVGCMNPCSKKNMGTMDNNQTAEDCAYKECVKSELGQEYFEMVQESCPDVIVFENQICDGGIYTCRKNSQGNSAYEIIFCP